jgi:hypothetical protein
MRPRSWLVVVCFGCGAAWTDSFKGQDTRVVPDAGVMDDSGAVDQCNALAASKHPVSPITVTFPGRGTPTAKIHVVAPSATCDVPVETDQQNVLFSSNALACAPILAPGTPGQGTVTASGNGGPNDLQFQWTYGAICTIVDDYSLSKQ